MEKLNYALLNLIAENCSKELFNFLKSWLVYAILEINLSVIFLSSVLIARIHDVLLFSFTAKASSGSFLHEHLDLVSFVVRVKKTFTALPLIRLISSTAFNTIKDLLFYLNCLQTWKSIFEPKRLLY